MMTVNNAHTIAIEGISEVFREVREIEAITRMCAFRHLDTPTPDGWNQTPEGKETINVMGDSGVIFEYLEKKAAKIVEFLDELEFAIRRASNE